MVERSSDDRFFLNSKSLGFWLKIIFLFAVIFVVIIFSLYFIKFSGTLSNNPSVWAAFGDFVGGSLGAILSFLALIALLITIHIQSKELEATRAELSRSALAQEKSEATLKKQSDILSRQQFEQTFFSLLEQHNLTLNELLATSSGRIGELTKLEDIKQTIFNQPALYSAKNKLEQKNHMCGHYFRILYQLLKFVATNIPNGEIGVSFDEAKIIKAPLADNEKMYSNIVRSFINYDVSQILAINCYCESESSTYWRYKLLIERYEFLEHMPFQDSDLFKEIRSYYNSAFGNSGFKKRFDNRHGIKSNCESV